MTFLELAAMWAPSLTAILGIAATVLVGLNKLIVAIKEFKADKTLIDLQTKMSELLNQNQALQETNKILVDKLTKIKDYQDNLAKSTNLSGE